MAVEEHDLVFRDVIGAESLGTITVRSDRAIGPWVSVDVRTVRDFSLRGLGLDGAWQTLAFVPMFSFDYGPYVLALSDPIEEGTEVSLTVFNHAPTARTFEARLRPHRPKAFADRTSD